MNLEDKFFSFYFKFSCPGSVQELFKFSERCICSCTGCYSIEENQIHEPNWRYSEAKTEVHWDCNRRQLWILVDGCLKVSENFPISSGGTFSGLTG